MDAAGLVELARSGASRDAQREALAGLLRERGVSGAGVQRILAHARDGVLLYDDGDVHASRIGGNGFLPPGESWPRGPMRRHMEFVAAIDLGELRRLAPLPATGTLLVYWAPENAMQDYVSGTWVRYVPREVPLEEHQTPDRGVKVAEPIPLAGARMPIPGELSRLADLERDDQDAAAALTSELGRFGRHQLLGASRDIQVRAALDEVREWMPRVGFLARRRYSEAERRGEGWTLLGQFGAVEGLRFGGGLFLTIPTVDLEALRFDRVMGILQT